MTAARLPYATAAQFIQEFGQEETCHLLRDELPLLTEELLMEALDGRFAEGRSEEEQQQALAAAKRLQDAIVEAANWMDGYLMSAAPLPLTAQQIAAAPIKTCCLELTRCQLMDDDDNATEGTEKRCKRWISWLRDVADRTVRLVAEQKGSGGVVSGKLSSAYNWAAFDRDQRGRW